MKHLTLLLLAAVVAQPTFADENSNGGSSGTIRRVGHGAALMALGNAGAAFPMSAESRMVNPALIGWWRTRQAALDWNRLSLDRDLMAVHVLWPLRPMGAFGLSYLRSSVDGIPETTTWGEPTGREMEAGEDLFSFGVALNPTRFLAVGMNMSILSGRFGDLDEGTTELKETTAAFDLGISIHPLKNIWTGVSVQNLGGSLAWDTSSLWGSGSASASASEDDLPVLLTAGVGGEFLKDRLLIVMDYEASDTDAWDLRGGAEWRSAPTELGSWALRGGWDDGSPTLGLGFAWPFATLEAGLDYAVTFHENDPDEIHTVTWRVTF